MLMRTTGKYMFKILDSFMEENNLQWNNCVGICSDGEPSMVGLLKGFTVLAKKEHEKIIFTHCFLHRENLVAKTTRNEPKEVVDQVVQNANYIKRRFNYDYLQNFVKKWKQSLKMLYYTQRFVNFQEEEYFVAYTN